MNQNELKKVTYPGVCKNYYASRDGSIYRLVGGAMKKVEPHWANRYLAVSGVRGGIPVHRIIAHTFLGPQKKGMHTNHIDGIQANNAVSNLEYCTPIENAHHYMKTRAENAAAENSVPFLKKQDLHDYCLLNEILKDESLCDIARKYFDRVSVWRWRNGIVFPSVERSIEIADIFHLEIGLCDGMCYFKRV